MLTILAGLTYCAIGALTFLKTDKPAPVLTPGSEEFESLIWWLVSRQTFDLGEDDEEQPTGSDKAQENLSQAVEALRLNGKVDALPPIEPPTEESLQWAGFNGRSNKAADTCYSFWNTATLAVSPSLLQNWLNKTNALKMLDRLALVDAARNRRYLLEKTQHLIGGFGKGVGEPPGKLAPLPSILDEL